MDPTVVLDPSLRDHFLVILVSTIIIVAGTAFLLKHAISQWEAAKNYVKDTVNKTLPTAIQKSLDDKLPGILDSVVAARLEAHEAVEEVKMQALIQNVQRDNSEFEQMVKGTTDQILSKLTTVEAHLQVVQARLESHDLRIRDLEYKIYPTKNSKKKSPRKK